MKKTLARSTSPRTSAHTGVTLRTRLGGALALVALAAGLGLASSRPAHTAGGPIAVAVANTPLAVLNRDSDSPARSAVGSTITLNNTSVGGTLSGTLYTVPAGKRLVIEHLSSSTNRDADANGYNIEVDTAQNGRRVATYFNEVPDAAPYSAASLSVRLYGDPGTPLLVTVFPSSKNLSDINISFSGYLVDAT